MFIRQLFLINEGFQDTKIGATQLGLKLIFMLTSPILGLLDREICFRVRGAQQNVCLVQLKKWKLSKRDAMIKYTATLFRFWHCE